MSSAVKGVPSSGPKSGEEVPAATEEDGGTSVTTPSGTTSISEVTVASAASTADTAAAASALPYRNGTLIGLLGFSSERPHKEKGQFGVIHHMETADGKHFVLKVIRMHPKYSEKEYRARLNKEAAVMRRLPQDCPNIVRFYDSWWCPSGNSFNIAMEYVDGTDLREEIVRRSGVLDGRELFSWTVQLLVAMHAMHACGVVHRDFKSDNVLLCKNGVVKVCDFGVSTVLVGPERLSSRGIGTPYTMGPEMLSKGVYDFRCDLWSLGCVLYECLLGQYAFAQARTVEALQELLRVGYVPPMDRPVGSIAAIACNCLRYTYQDRPDAMALLEDFSYNKVHPGQSWCVDAMLEKRYQLALRKSSPEVVSRLNRSTKGLSRSDALAELIRVVYPRSLRPGVARLLSMPYARWYQQDSFRERMKRRGEQVAAARLETRTRLPFDVDAAAASALAKLGIHTPSSGVVKPPLAELEEQTEVAVPAVAATVAVAAVVAVTAAAVAVVQDTPSAAADISPLTPAASAETAVCVSQVGMSAVGMSAVDVASVSGIEISGMVPLCGVGALDAPWAGSTSTMDGDLCSTGASPPCPAPLEESAGMLPDGGSTSNNSCDGPVVGQEQPSGPIPMDAPMVPDTPTAQVPGPAEGGHDALPAGDKAAKSAHSLAHCAAVPVFRDLQRRQQQQQQRQREREKQVYPGHRSVSPGAEQRGASASMSWLSTVPGEDSSSAGLLGFDGLPRSPTATHVGSLRDPGALLQHRNPSMPGRRHMTAGQYCALAPVGRERWSTRRAPPPHSLSTATLGHRVTAVSSFVAAGHPGPVVASSIPFPSVGVGCPPRPFASPAAGLTRTQSVKALRLTASVHGSLPALPAGCSLYRAGAAFTGDGGSGSIPSGETGSDDRLPPQDSGAEVSGASGASRTTSPCSSHGPLFHLPQRLVRRSPARTAAGSAIGSVTPGMGARATSHLGTSPPAMSPIVSPAVSPRTHLSSPGGHRGRLTDGRPASPTPAS